MNRVCVVTGGAAGIGRCIVEMFAESGYTVYFIDKTPEAVELAEGKMSERGPCSGKHLSRHYSCCKCGDTR